MIPRIVHWIWLGEKIPEQMSKWMGSIRDKNPNWGDCLWGERGCFDLGFDVRKMKSDLGSWASVSNILRLEILFKFGGVYLDTDIEGKKSLDEFPWKGAIAAVQDTNRICNAFMGAERMHPWVKWQLDHLKDYDQKDPASGVYLASAAPREGLTLVDPTLVYPFSYDTPLDQRLPHPDSILVHHWSASWGKCSA